MERKNTLFQTKSNIVESEMKIASREYSTEFWDMAMRGFPVNESIMDNGRVKNGMFKLPLDSGMDYQKALVKESIFRNIATCIDAPRSDSTIWISDSDVVASFVPDNQPINVESVTEDLIDKKVECNKVAVITTYREDLVSDIGFNLKKHLISTLAKGFNRAEENAFINGTGEKEPIGILHETEGAEIGVTTADITFDNISELFLSLEPKYRKQGVWLMNDETALMLRKLKDKDGNYVWNHNTDTIFGKPVYTSEFMPKVASGNKPIVFGDFSYYWIINRIGISVRALVEKFAIEHRKGYLACEYLDARLIRSEAIKTIKIS